MFKNIYSILIIVTIVSLLTIGIVFLFGDKKEIDSLTGNISGSLNNNELSQEPSSSSAKIINLHSHPQQGENWIISFQTEGTADLRIIPQDKATIDDDEFVSLWCESEQRTSQILENDVIYYPNWHCDGTAQIIHYTKKAGRHTFKFQFGQTVMYAYNSAAWYNSAWGYRKKITIQNAYVDSSLTNFPLYVDITSDANIGASAQTDGDDILFTTDDGITKISHEEEYFNISAGSATGHYWVKVPAINSGTTTDIYIYYGNSSASDQQQVTDVWDSNFKAVYHMNSTSWIDSTSVGNDGTTVGSVTTSASGKVGTAGSFPAGAGNYINLGDGNSNLDLTNKDFTMSAWIKPDVDDTTLLIGLESNSSANGINLSRSSTNVISYNNNGSAKVSTESVTAAAGWAYVSFRIDYLGYDATTDQVYFYVNGTANNDDFYSNKHVSAYDYCVIGVDPRDKAGYEFDGLMDEYRVSNTFRSDEWIKFEYYNMNEVDNELEWDTQESFSVPVYMRIK